MARDLNNVMIIGRLGSDPELRYRPLGSPVTLFRLAPSCQSAPAPNDSGDEDIPF